MEENNIRIAKKQLPDGSTMKIYPNGDAIKGKK